MFGFNESFTKAVKEIKTTHWKQSYIDPITEEIKCVLNDRGEIFDIKGNLERDQNSFKYMIEMDILKPLEKEYTISEGLDLKSIKAEKESNLKEHPAYIIKANSRQGIYKMLVTEEGKILKGFSPMDALYEGISLKDFFTSTGKESLNLSELKKDLSNSEYVLFKINHELKEDFKAIEIEEV